MTHSQSVPEVVQPKVTKRKNACIVELGRYGDIINILPIAQHVHDTYGKPFFMVSRRFADVLDGVSYVEPFIVDLDNSQINEALRITNENFEFVINTQIWGRDYVQVRECPSFNMESWRMGGMLRKFGDATMRPLFDRRDVKREYDFLMSMSGGRKPIVLVQVTKSDSSPFSQGGQLLGTLNASLSSRFTVIDLSRIECERIYDLLGLFEIATALVSIDTAYLHLATASNIPTVAIVNPAPWMGTIMRSNCVARFTYNEAAVSSHRVVEAVLRAATIPHAAIETRQPRVAPARKVINAGEWHIPATKEDRERFAAAQLSRALLDRFVYRRCLDFPRTSKVIIGDQRNLPFLKDCLQFAMKEAKDEDIICLTNSDNWLHPELIDLLKFHCAVYDVCTSQRCDIRGPLPDGQTPFHIALHSDRHPGRDLFAATKRWLVENWNEIPDYILGAEIWDLGIAALVRRYHGLTTTRQDLARNKWPAEIKRGYVAHQVHAPAWADPKTTLQSKSNVHNRKLFRAWSEQYLPSLKFNTDNRLA